MIWIFGALLYVDGSGSMKSLYTTSLTYGKSKNVISTVVEAIKEEINVNYAYFFGMTGDGKAVFRPFTPHKFPQYYLTDLPSVLWHFEKNYPKKSKDDIGFIITDNIQDAELANSLSLFYRGLRKYAVVVIMLVRFVKKERVGPPSKYAFVIYAIKKSSANPYRDAQLIYRSLFNVKEAITATVGFGSKFEATEPIVLRPFMDYNMDYKISVKILTYQLPWPKRPHIKQYSMIKPVWKNSHIRPVNPRIYASMVGRIVKGRSVFKTGTIRYILSKPDGKKSGRILEIVPYKKNELIARGRFPEYTYTPQAIVYVLLNEFISFRTSAFFKGEATNAVWDRKFLEEWGLNFNPPVISPTGKVPNLAGMNIITKDTTGLSIKGKWKKYDLGRFVVGISWWYRTTVVLSIGLFILIALLFLAIIIKPLSGGG